METIKLMRIMSSSTKAKIILRLLTCKCKNITVKELCKIFDLKQSNISKHFMDLRKEGIVDFNKQGRETFYSINHEFYKNNDKILLSILENAQSETITNSLCKNKS